LVLGLAGCPAARRRVGVPLGRRLLRGGAHALAAQLDDRLHRDLRPLRLRFRRAARQPRPVAGAGRAARGTGRHAHRRLARAAAVGRGVGGSGSGLVDSIVQRRWSGGLASVMLDTNTLSALLARGKAAGADFAEVYAERTRQRSLRVVDGEVQEATSVVQLGAGIRLFFGHDVLYGYTNDLSDAGLTEVLDSLVAVRDDGVGRPDAGGRGGLDLRRSDAFVPLPGPRVPPDARDKRWRLERLREADAGARVDPAVKQVEATLAEVEQEVMVANTDGVLADDQRTRTRLVVHVIASDGVETQTGHH